MAFPPAARDLSLPYTCSMFAPAVDQNKHLFSRVGLLITMLREPYRAK